MPASYADASTSGLAMNPPSFRRNFVYPQAVTAAVTLLAFLIIEQIAHSVGGAAFGSAVVVLLLAMFKLFQFSGHSDCEVGGAGPAAFTAALAATAASVPPLLSTGSPSFAFALIWSCLLGFFCSLIRVDARAAIRGSSSGRILRKIDRSYLIQMVGVGTLITAYWLWR